MLHQIRYFFFTAIILAIAFPQAVLGQNWEWQAPILPPYTYNDIHIFDDLKAVAVGSSGIMIWTEDAGENWEVRQSVNGVTATFISVSFFDENHGIAVGSASGGNGALLHTKDGGVTWEPDRSFPYVVSLLSDVVMVSETVAYASGTQGRVFKTTNGGATWSVKNVGESRTLHAIHFFDADNGLTIGQFGSIYKTEDGGDNWVKITSGTNNELFNIQFIDDDLGFIGARAQFLKTTDGGETWEVTVPEGVRYVRAMKFFNENDGILISSNQLPEINNTHTINRTSDGGGTWDSDTFITLGIIESVDRFTPDNLWAFGSNGVVQRSSDNGDTWVDPLNRSNLSTLVPIDFGIYLAIGSNWDILYTDSDGSSWSVWNSPDATGFFSSAAAFNTEHVLLSGPDGAMYRTEDSGETWTEFDSETGSSFFEMAFTDNGIGIGVMLNGSVYRTTDWGANWELLTGLGTFQKYTVAWNGVSTFAIG